MEFVTAHLFDNTRVGTGCMVLVHDVKLNKMTLSVAMHFFPDCLHL